MAWHYATVPGRGWVELRATAARLQSDFVKIVGDVTVDATDPMWASYPGDNFLEIQKAIMARVRTARIVRSFISRRERALVQIARPREPGAAGWLDYWSDTLDVTVLKVHRWDVVPIRPKRHQ